MVNYKRIYTNKLAKLLADSGVCKENRDIFKEFFEYQEIKLKRRNGLRQLDEGCYSTLYDYVKRLRIVNDWFKNKPWTQLTKQDIEKVFNDVEDGKILSKRGKPIEGADRYYSKIMKSKPFQIAGKAALAREVITYRTAKQKAVRFITEGDFRKLVENAYKPHHKLLLWLSWDIGENIISLLRLRKRDFTRQNSEHNKEPEYRVNLKKEILKRSRLPRSEITNYPETTLFLDQELAKIKEDDLVFKFDYLNAKKLIDRLVERTGIKCTPDKQKPTWKDLRSGMACDLLKKGWNTDEVNARLGHRPSSSEIDRYVNFLALDRHKPKAKVHNFEMSKLKDEINALKNNEQLQAQRIAKQESQIKILVETLCEIRESLREAAKNS